MSGRGGGRGRGRGRGGPVTGARLFMQRSAQEAGLDAGNLRNLHDITKAKLFPDFEWHSSGRRGHDELPEGAAASTGTVRNKASTVYLINKSREIHDRFQNSPFFVRPKQEVDVVRYGKRPRPLEPDIFVLEHMGQAADERWMPKELLQKTGQGQKSMKELSGQNEDGPKKELTLEEMAAQELKRRQQAAEPEEGDDLSDAVIVEEEEDEEADDYMIDHYESDDESDGGGEEPTI
jgi:hypothetical protein